MYHRQDTTSSAISSVSTSSSASSFHRTDSICSSEMGSNSNLSETTSVTSRKKDSMGGGLLYGDVTLQMIDDFFNPDKRNSSESISFLLPGCTAGHGIRRTETAAAGDMSYAENVLNRISTSVNTNQAFSSSHVAGDLHSRNVSFQQ